jgi:hypothetical protein
LRSDFASSRLVSLLGAWTPVEGDGSGMDFAERLSLWLNAFDAIGLQAAHRSIEAIRTAAPGVRGARPVRAEDLQEDIRRVRTVLSAAIARDPIEITGADPADPGYGPYRQRHLELQRQMEQMIAPLRDHVRQALSRVSPALRRLAALDAVLEQVLAAREQQLLPTTAALLERRHDQLRRQQADESSTTGPDWRDAFERDWRQALLAELDLRLEPVTGLVDALSNTSKHREE